MVGPLLLALAIGEVAQPKYEDSRGRFVVDLPTGWTVHEVDSAEGMGILACKAGGSVAIVFQELPGEWTLDTFLSMLETAMQESFLGPAELQKTVDLEAGDHAGRLTLYRNERLGGTVVLGGVLLRGGGVSIQGIVSQPPPEQGIVALLRSVRPTSVMPAIVPGSPSGVGLATHRWAVHADLSGFKVADDERRPDGLARKVFYKHQDPRIHLTILIKPAEASATLVSIRDERLSALAAKPPDEVGVRTAQDSDSASMEYFVEVPVQDGPLHQRNVHTFWTHDGSRIEIHVSVTRYTDADGEWLATFLRSVRIVKG